MDMNAIVRVFTYVNFFMMKYKATTMLEIHISYMYALWLPFQPQHALPDVFLWLVSGTKRLAYKRISARDILYSMVEEEKGKDCGMVQSVFLKVSACVT